MKLTIYTDGSCRTNPGEASIGCVVLEGSTELCRISERISIHTNNEAEVLAIKAGLEAALNFGATEIKIYTDSRLAANHLRGTFKVKAQNLSILYDDVKPLLSRFKGVEIFDIPREQNKLADKLADDALKGVD